MDEHVQESLARHCMEELSDPKAALPHYMAVLRHPSSSLAAQTQHMTKFLEAVLQSEETAVCVFGCCFGGRVCVRVCVCGKVKVEGLFDGVPVQCIGHKAPPVTELCTHSTYRSGSCR